MSVMIDRSEARTTTGRRTALLAPVIAVGGVGWLATILFAWNGAGASARWYADHPSAWAASTYGTAAQVLGLFAFLLAVALLVRGRGAAWATAAVVVGAIGGALHAVSVTIPVAYTGFGQLPPDEASALIDRVSRTDLTESAVAFPAFLLLTVTQILVTVALVRSQAVPLWMPVLFVASGVVAIVFAASGALTAVLTVPQIVAMVAIGHAAHRAR